MPLQLSLWARTNHPRSVPPRRRSSHSFLPYSNARPKQRQNPQFQRLISNDEISQNGNAQWYLPKDHEK